jgi:hypothetical protein
MPDDFCVAPDNSHSLELGDNDAFIYGLSFSDDATWSDDAVMRIVSDDGEQTDFGKSDGKNVDDFVFFTFTKSRKGVSYRAVVVDGDVEFELFGPIELWRLQDASDPCSWLPLPEVARDDDDNADESEDSDESTDDAPASDA